MRCVHALAPSAVSRQPRCSEHPVNSLPQAQVNTRFGEMVEALGKHLKRGARIRISGLGILQVRKRPARMGRNPATGEAIKIKKKIAFRASKDLKELVM